MKNDKGQALTEYVLVISLCLLLLLGVMAGFLDAVGDFYSNVLAVVCLPLP